MGEHSNGEKFGEVVPQNRWIFKMWGRRDILFMSNGKMLWNGRNLNQERIKKKKKKTLRN